MKAFPAQLFAVRDGGAGVSGPSTSTDNAIVRHDGAGGAVQGSPVTISDEASDTVTVAAAGASSDTNLIISTKGAGYLEHRVAGSNSLYISTGGSSRWSVDSGGVMTAQHASSRIVVQGTARLKGSTSSAADPNTSDYAVNEWGLHKNTTTGIWYLAINDGGAIKKVALA
ncbi:MAG TPA: hypothetical protein DEH78_19075 [Solibacterales bacterium]|nr:hypothetical protein [Bryobacterales bacterium]